MDRLSTEEIFKPVPPPDAAGVPAPSRPSARRRLLKIAGSVIPWLIIVGLLWAGLFIKPQPVPASVQPQVIERRDFFYGIATPAPSVLWIAGTNGKIARSEDDGRNWTLQPIAIKTHLQDIAAWDTHTAIVVGNRGAAAITSNGGAAWTEVNVPKSKVANKLTRVLALPQGSAWVVGEMGALLHSADFGKTWERRREEEDVAWNDIAFADAKNGWVVGEFGRILRTTDGGASWQPVQAPVKSSLIAVSFMDARHGVAVGLEGVVLRTSDGGATWLPAQSGTKEHLLAVVWNDKNDTWIASGNQGVWAAGTADASRWQSGRLDQRDLAWHTKATALNGKIYLAGSNVGVWDGKSWQVMTSGSPQAAEENMPLGLHSQIRAPSTR